MVFWVLLSCFFFGKASSEANASRSLGVEVLESIGYFTGSYWYWIGLGALLGMIVVFNVLSTLAMTYLGRE